jgi:hypothetical protein
MRRSRAGEKMKNKEKVNLYRMLAVVVMIFATLVVTFVLCYMNHLYLDEILCLLFLDLIFILTYVFEMEYERKKDRLSDNSQTTYIRLVAVYVICCILMFGMAYMPEFFRPVMILPILICSVSNPVMALSVGLFFDIILALTAGGSFYALVCYVALTLIGGVAAQALAEKRFRIKLAFLCLFANLMVPDILYYLCYNDTEIQAVFWGLGNGVVTAFIAIFIFPWLWKNARREVDNRLLDITSVDYSEVKALKDFSLSEYKHAVHVSNVAYLCAKSIGLDKNVCLAAGFYYRMGQWLGEPCVQNGVDKAIALCFPESVIRILSEYYGEDKLPSTPESALVHMVDALVVRIGAEKKKSKKEQFDSELLIYTSLNEFSSSGIYDKSGMSMNLYIKIRAFLAKEELLH